MEGTAADAEEDEAEEVVPPAEKLAVRLPEPYPDDDASLHALHRKVTQSVTQCVTHIYQRNALRNELRTNFVRNSLRNVWMRNELRCA